MKEQVEEKLDKIKDNAEFVENITREKRKITEEIKRIDETLNNKDLLQEEYEERNKNLPLEEKIFSFIIDAHFFNWLWKYSRISMYS